MRESTRFEPAVKAELLALVARTGERTGWTLRRILKQLGLSKARYREWLKRAERDALADRSTAAPVVDAILPEEKHAVLATPWRTRRTATVGWRGR